MLIYFGYKYLLRIEYKGNFKAKFTIQNFPSPRTVAISKYQKKQFSNRWGGNCWVHNFFKGKKAL